MPPQTPLLLVDNVYDTIMQYPNGSLVASGVEVPGHEAFRIADYRRERTSWKPTLAAAGHSLVSDLGAGVTRAVDFLYIDRGHQLWDTDLQLSGDDGFGGGTWTVALTVPVVGTLGGDPTSGTMCVTEEGALYSLIALQAARRRFGLAIVDNILPVVTGLIVGRRTQLLGYSNVFDEDAGERTETSLVSTAGYKGTDTTCSWRTCELGLTLIGATEYDASIRALRTLLFDRNQPVVIAMDYGTHPERAWMYQLDGKGWAFGKKRVHREGRLRFREVGQSLS